MKHLMNFRHAMALAVALTMGMGFSACTKNAEKGQSTEQTSGTDASPAGEARQEGQEMKAPSITPDADGMITLAQCPTEYEGLKVVVSEDLTKAEIFLNDQLLQTITDDDQIATDNDASIHFMDANFDGYVDIFIGPGESRTYSTLLTWDPSTRQFKRLGTLGEPSLQNFALHPAEKCVFEGGSASYCANYFVRSIWENDALKTLDELIIVSDPEQYGEYEVSGPYTLRDANHDDIISTDDPSQFPDIWKAILGNYK